MNYVTIILWMLGIVAMWFDHSVALVLFAWPAGVAAGTAFGNIQNNKKRN